MHYWYFAALIALTIFSAVDGIMFRLTPNSKKCLREEIHRGVLVVGEYDLNDVPGHKTDLQVKDTKGHTLVNREDITSGKFAFTTDDYDVFEICFVSKVPSGHRVQDRDATLNMKHGVEAKTYEGLADAAKLKPLEVELRRLEDLSSAIVSDFEYMKNREEEMRDTNESTATRVLYFSVFSMCCLLGLATWQVVYLRTFFKSKKLIE